LLTLLIVQTILVANVPIEIDFDVQLVQLPIRVGATLQVPLLSAAQVASTKQATVLSPVQCPAVS
jgi:hypothetical protein